MGLKKTHWLQKTFKFIYPRTKRFQNTILDVLFYARARSDTLDVAHAWRTCLHELVYMKSIVDPDRLGDVKIAIPAPHWYHLRYKYGRTYKKALMLPTRNNFKDLFQRFGNCYLAERGVRHGNVV